LTDATKAGRQSLIDSRKALADAKISSIGQITSSANTFQNSLSALGSSKAISYSTQSSDPTVADFSFKSFIQPKPLNFTFSVKQLATENIVTLPPISSSATSLLGSSTSRVLTLFGAPPIASATVASGSNPTNLAIPTGSLTPGSTMNLSLPTSAGSTQNLQVAVPASGDINDFIASINTSIAKTGSSAPIASLGQDGASVSFSYNGSPQPSGSIALATSIKQFDLSGYTKLSDLANDITAVTGFSANIMNSPSGSDTLQYLQISHGTGQANNFNVAITDPNDSQPLTTGLSTDQGSGPTVQVGQDAIINAAGIDYTSSSNAFSNLITGVTINVHAASTGSSQVNLSTAINTSGLLSAMQAIVTGYNSLLTTVQDSIKYDPDVTKRGGLANDWVAQSFLSQLRQLTTTSIAGSGTTPVTLADIGVKTNLDGSLTIDTAAVDRVSQNNPQMLADVIASTNTSTGAIDLMANLNKVITSPAAPLQIELTQVQGKDEQAIADDQTKLDTEMAALQQRYLTQFTAMQSILNSTKNDQSGLTNMMSSWSAGLKS
jgi:flagellar hook-associated protein 2